MQLQPDHYRQLIRILGLKSKRAQTGSRGFYYCPFHSEKTPSFSIDMNQGVFNCFACKRGGNFRQLSQMLTNRSAEDLLRIDDPFLAATIESSIARPLVEKEVVEDDGEVHIRGVTTPFMKSQEAIQYLESRKISLDVATALNILYIEEAYINGSTYIQKRICTPVYSTSGKLINMDCRDITRKDGVIKVLYPKGGIKTVFEHYKLDKTKPLYVLEGMLKMMAARSDPFFANSTTTLGASPSALQIRILNTFSEVILIPDNDRAGEDSIRNLQQKLDTRFSVMRIGDDTLKDMDEIPVKKKMSVKEFREKNGFFYQTIPMLIF